MNRAVFSTPDGRAVPTVSAREMATVDGVAVDEVGLSLLMMMEHAGRALAETVFAVAPEGPVTVLAGGGGNGGGGLCAARHLVNHGRDVAVVLDRAPDQLSGAPARQWRILEDGAADRTDDAEHAIDDAVVTVDALVGYSLRGAPQGRVADLVERVADRADRVVSLDVPTGVDATSGERPGLAVEPDNTVTLALPKTGLASVDGELRLADIGLTARVFELAGIEYRTPFAGSAWLVPIELSDEGLFD